MSPPVNATIHAAAPPVMTAFGPLPPGAPQGFAMTKARLERNIGSAVTSLWFFLGAWALLWYRNRANVLRHYKKHAGDGRPESESSQSSSGPRKAPIPHWRNPATYEMAWRPISSFFSILVPICLLNAVDVCGIWHSWLANKCIHTEPLFSVVVAYFVADSILMVLFGCEMWPIYVMHHVVAASPYITNNFIPGCSQGHLLLSVGVLVEFTTPFLNWCWWLERDGQQGSTRYLAAQLLTWVLWIPFRLVLPGILLYKVWQHIIPAYGGAPMIIPSLVMAHFITLFCVVAWIVFISPAVVRSWGPLCCAWCCRAAPSPPLPVNGAATLDIYKTGISAGCTSKDGVGWLAGGPGPDPSLHVVPGDGQEPEFGRSHASLNGGGGPSNNNLEDEANEHSSLLVGSNEAA